MGIANRRWGIHTTNHRATRTGLVVSPSTSFVRDLFPPSAGGVERSPQPGTGKAGASGESANHSETGGKQVDP